MIILIISFIFFLFTLFVFSRDDYVLFRKNVDIEKVFNLAFLVIIAALFFSRLTYAILFFKPVFLNPLAFLLFPYFPGLSLPGGLLGGSIVLAILLRGKKYPEGRLFDFFILAVTVGLIVSEIPIFISSLLIKSSILLPGATVLFHILMLLILLHIFKKHAVKEGNIALITIMCLSIGFLITTFLGNSQNHIFLYKEMGMWSLVFLISCIVFFRQNPFMSFGKK